MNKQKLIQKAMEAGFEQVEIYTSSNRSNAIQLYQGDVDGFTISESGGIAVRGIYEGKLGYCFLEEETDANIDFCIQQMMQNAKAITSTDAVMIYAGDASYPEIEKSVTTVQNTTTEERIAFLKEMETLIQQADKRIVQVMSCAMQVIQGSVSITNSKGLNLEREVEFAILAASILANEDKDHKSGSEYVLIHDFNQFDKQAFVDRLVHKAIDKLNAVQPISGKYPVVLKNNVMCDLLATVSGIFNGENAYKGISILKDKINTPIFNEKVTLVDNPLYPNGVESTPFDDEGVASKCKKVVENGVLKTYLHNLKSAMLMHTESTGNGFKSGYSGSVGIQPTNFYFEKGNTDFDEVIATIQKGVLIDSVEGLHAGFNAFTTDFSLQASGFMIEDGKITHPVHLITVAGNFIEMMKEVSVIADDLKFELSGCGSASMKFDSLTISGR